MTVGDGGQLAHHVLHALQLQGGRAVDDCRARALATGADAIAQQDLDAGTAAAFTRAVEPVRQRLFGHAAVQRLDLLRIPRGILRHPAARAATADHLVSPDTQQLRQIAHVALHGPNAGRSLGGRAHWRPPWRVASNTQRGYRHRYYYAAIKPYKDFADACDPDQPRTQALARVFSGQGQLLWSPVGLASRESKREWSM